MYNPCVVRYMHLAQKHVGGIHSPVYLERYFRDSWRGVASVVLAGWTT